MPKDMIPPATGTLIIAHPMLPDPNFARSVVLLCEHNREEGSFGLVLSNKLENPMSEIMETLADFEETICLGGPVQNNTLHYIHQHGDLVTGAVEIQDGVYWGGDFDMIQALVISQETDSRHLRFFAGYAGWGAEQLQEEIDEGSWFVTEATPDLVFETEPAKLWRTVLRKMGGPYAFLANFPTDPRLN